jgi:hypothetical protein
VFEKVEGQSFSSQKCFQPAFNPAQNSVLEIRLPFPLVPLEGCPGIQMQENLLDKWNATNASWTFGDQMGCLVPGTLFPTEKGAGCHITPSDIFRQKNGNCLPNKRIEQFRHRPPLSFII